MSQDADAAASHLTAVTVKEQLALLTLHVARLAEKRDRYALHSVPYFLANIEVIIWSQVVLVLTANLDGKVVPP